jgi:hypothetical protein
MPWQLTQKSRRISVCAESVNKVRSRLADVIVEEFANVDGIDITWAVAQLYEIGARRLARRGIELAPVEEPPPADNAPPPQRGLN